MTTLLERRPSRVPDGYSLRYTLTDGREPGFGWAREQTVLVYTRGWSPSDFTFPLMVCLGRADGPDLVGTRADRAQALDIGVPGVEAVYHDGILTPRLDSARDFAGTEWQQGEVHSITARSAAGAFAVRGPRNLPRDELVATLLSLSPAE